MQPVKESQWPAESPRPLFRRQPVTNSHWQVTLTLTFSCPASSRLNDSTILLTGFMTQPHNYWRNQLWSQLSKEVWTTNKWCINTTVPVIKLSTPPQKWRQQAPQKHWQLCKAQEFIIFTRQVYCCQIFVTTKRDYTAFYRQMEATDSS